jgi:hypothetical protein
MENEQASVHSFDIDLICEYFAGLERQGPGSPDAAMKALSFIDGLSKEPKIADLGCGTGGQTMILAQNNVTGNIFQAVVVQKLKFLNNSITGVDRFPGFIRSEGFNTPSFRAFLRY